MKKPPPRLTDLGNVLVSKSFQDAWQKLSAQQQRILIRKVALLRANPRHPSLKAHRLRRSTEDIWACYVSGTQRLLYRHTQGKLHLCMVGPHGIVDKIHVYQFAS